MKTFLRERVFRLLIALSTIGATALVLEAGRRWV
jgi:hypothetical protein